MFFPSPSLSYHTVRDFLRISKLLQHCLLLWRWPRIQTNYASLRSSSNIIRNSNSNQTQKVSEKLQTRDPISVSMNSHALYDTAAYLPYLTFSFGRLDVGISWKIKTTMTYLVCILLWNHIRFSFIAKNFGQCNLSIYRLVRGFCSFPSFICYSSWKL